jgi:hypothetical protein
MIRAQITGGRVAAGHSSTQGKGFEILAATRMTRAMLKPNIFR